MVALLAAVLLVAASTGRAQAPNALETFDAVWRTVRDSHFDKTLNGVDWDRVAAELRPKAVAAVTVGELRAVLRDMLGRLGQSHFAIIPGTPDSVAELPRDLSASPGFDVRLVGRDLVVTDVEPDGPAAASGVKTGWKVLTVDSASMQTLLGYATRTPSSRACCTSRPGASAIRASMVHRDRARTSRSRTASARSAPCPSSAVPEAASRSLSAACRRCSCACRRRPQRRRAAAGRR